MLQCSVSIAEMDFYLTMQRSLQFKILLSLNISVVKKSLLQKKFLNREQNPSTKASSKISKSDE